MSIRIQFIQVSTSKHWLIVTKNSFAKHYQIDMVFSCWLFICITIEWGILSCWHILNIIFAMWIPATYFCSQTISSFQWHILWTLFIYINDHFLSSNDILFPLIFSSFWIELVATQHLKRMYKNVPMSLSENYLVFSMSVYGSQIAQLSERNNDNNQKMRHKGDWVDDFCLTKAKRNVSTPVFVFNLV